MRRTKANRALTFVMAAALLIGSIHGVGAKEQSKAYDAPELTFIQGVTDYDLTAGITYDSEKYTMSVTDTGNFDVNMAGDYEISYALTEKESSVNVTESVENTESADSVESIENIESTETMSGTETIETTDVMATVEDTDQTPEGDATNTVDTQEKQVITFTRTVHVVAASEDEVPMYEARELVLVQGEEGYDLTDEILYDDVKYTLEVVELGGFDINKIGSYEVTYSLTPVTTEGTQGNGQNDTQENQVITFQRTVTVKAAVEENALYEAPDLYLEWGQEDYDLTEGIIYDKDLYTLKVEELGGFDINVLGEYKVGYALTLKIDGVSTDTKKVTPDEDSMVAVDSVNVTGEETVSPSQTDKVLDNELMFGSDVELDEKTEDFPQTISFSRTVTVINNIVTMASTGNREISYISYDFDGSMTDERGHSTVNILGNGNPGNASQSFGEDTYGTYWTWNASGNRGGGFWLYVDKKMDGNYTFGMKFCLSQTSGGNGWKKIIDYRNRSADTGFYFLNKNLKFFDLSANGNAKVENDQVIDLIVQRSGADKSYKAYIIDERGISTLELDAIDSNDQGVPYYNGIQTVLGFFFDDYVSAGAEGAASGKIYKLKIWDSVVDLDYAIMELQSTQATIGDKKYISVQKAIEDAQAGDTIKIVKSEITATGDIKLPANITIEDYSNNTYKAVADSTINVSEFGVTTIKDGVLKLSANAPIKVYNQIDAKTYDVTAPDCTSTVRVGENGGEPYIMGDADGSVKINTVTYSYQNPSQSVLAMVYIPQGMKNNDHITKAEVAADQSVTIEVDNTNSVVLNGSGNAGDTVIVERRQDDSKVDVKLPSGAQGTILGHTVGVAPSGGVTVSQSSVENTGYPDRDYIMVAATGNEVVVDGITYRATSANQKFYLGTFQVNTTFGSHAGVKGAKPSDPHYLEEYTITICPDTDYDLDKDNFVLTMKENDTADAKNLAFATYCTEEADGSIKVTIPKVTGDITIYAEAKKQTSKLTINGLDGRGIVKVLDGEGHVHELKQGKDSVTVNRNEELTLTFIPDDFTEPYYGDLTGEKGSSFSILTGLKDNTLYPAVAELFTQDVKDSFNWTEKSYQVKYTPDKAENTLEATFTHSSIMHVHVTGGTAEVKTTGLVQNPADTGSFRHVIVPDNTQVEITLKDTTSHNPVYKAAYWKQASTAGGNDMGTDVSSQLNAAGSKTYTYTTQAVSASHMLNVSFEQGQNVDVTFTGGNASLVQTGTTSWTDQGNHTYRTLVKNGNKLTLKVQVNEGYGLKSITVNGYTINATAALNNPDYNVTYDEATRTYTHTTKPIDQAWNVVMDFEEQYTVSFVDQKDRTLGSTPAVNGTTIPEEKFTEMQNKTDALKEADEIFLTWVDKVDGNTAYNKNTIITKNNLVLKPVYRKNAGNGGHIENGSDGSILAADDFVIHLRDLQNLTADNVKDEKYANVTAFDKNGTKVTSQVTVNADELTALQAKSAGTYRDALTFTYNNLSVKVTVEISDAEVTITGRTAHTLTFTGKGGVTYQVQKSDENGGSLTGNVMSAATAAGTGKGTADGLDKAAYYLISHKAYGQAVGRTSLVDAQDIAKQFADDGDQTTTNGKTDKNETASNKNVEVTVDDNGNYKVTLKKNIDHTVEIPDIWENVKIDLGGHTITGDNADASNEAKPGLVFKKDDTAIEHPGTNLEIVNGTIKGGDGSAKHPDGAAGIGASGDTADAGIIIGSNANVTGGNGADGTEGKDGGNGGAGIDGNGKLTPTVSGTVTGGNGGKGGDSAAGIPGNGGNGGTGISAGDKTITINPGGTVKGGDAGNGGNATGDNTNPGGNGGNGGTGTETTQPGKTDNNGGTTSGGNGGDGGKSDNGNGGNGGNGGSGSTGESNNNGGTNSGGSGGNGGDSDKGNGGSGGNGGSSGETGGNGGNNTGGNGGNGGDSNNGNGGSGGNGGESNSGTGGNGGNGGDSNNGTGGNGGNGGESNSGNGGNGGNGGDSNNGTGGNGGNGKNPGTGGNGGGSNSGNNGSSGSDGSKPDNNGGNGGSNGGDNGNNNGGSGSGGNSNGDTNGTNTGVTDGKTNATDIAAADGNNASGGNKNSKHNRNNRNNKSDQADGEDVTEGTETDADTGSDDTTDVADSTETGADADGSGNTDDSIPADSSDADGHISFADCGFHWYPVILILVIAGYTVLRIRKIREELDGE